jgi:hypothetical protein
MKQLMLLVVIKFFKIKLFFSLHGEVFFIKILKKVCFEKFENNQQ